MLYLVSYDITEKNRDYQSLWDELARLEAVRILYSEWATPYYGSALELLKLLRQHIETGDKLFVCELFNSQVLAWTGNLQVSSEIFKGLLNTHARKLS